MTWPPELRPPRGREVFRVPRRSAPLRASSRPVLPRLPPFLLSPIVRSILPVCFVSFEILAAGVLHPQVLGGEGPYPVSPRQLRDPDLEPLPPGLSLGDPLFERSDPPGEAGRDRVQVDAPQHQQHRYDDHHREPAAASGRLLPRRPVRPLSPDGRGDGPRSRRGPGPALRSGHQDTSPVPSSSSEAL